VAIDAGADRRSTTGRRLELAAGDVAGGHQQLLELRDRDGKAGTVWLGAHCLLRPAP
jgi:hypothetical protein